MDIGESLFLSHGYGGFSYHDIAIALGMKNAAIHYHFPSKVSLVMEIFKRARLRFDQWKSEIDEVDMPALDKLNEMLKFLFFKHASSQDKVCLVGNSAVSYSMLPDNARSEVKMMINDINDWTKALLESSRDQNELGFEGNALDKARAITAAVSGAVQFARIAGPGHFTSTIRQINLELSNTHI